MQRTDLQTRVGEEGEGEVNGGSSMQAYIPPYVKQALSCYTPL